MQSTTLAGTTQDLLAEAEQRLGPRDWEQLAQSLGLDLEASAKATKALLRRRGVQRAVDLLRLILVYSVCDWSLRLVGAWFYLAGLGELSDVAVLKRLRHSQVWIGQLIVQVLHQRYGRLTRLPGVRIELRDATVISAPGSTGTDWRVHLRFDVGALALVAVELTDAHGGETFARFPGDPGVIDVGDRGHGFAKSIGSLLVAKGRFVVRITWQNLPLVMPGQPRWKLSSWLKGHPTPRDAAVQVKTPEGTFPVRVLAVPLPKAQVQAARARARAAAKKKGHTVRPETLRAAAYVLLVTNLDPTEWPLERVALLYRWRWQVELAIKRLKSVWTLDGLRADDPGLAQTYLLGKLLAALLLEEPPQTSTETLPEWWTSETQPVSPWRVMQLGVECLRQVLVGALSLGQVQAHLAALRRYLCEPPRRRKQQLAAARALLARLSTS